MNFISLFLALFLELPAGLQLSTVDADSVLYEMLSSGDYNTLSLAPELLGEYIAEDWIPRFRGDDKSVGGEGVSDPRFRGDDKSVGGEGVSDPRFRGDDKSLRVMQVISLSATQSTWAEGVSFRYRLKIIQPGRWEARFLTDHAPGEGFGPGPLRVIPDHLSGGLMIRPGGMVRELVIGDYQVSSGFGAVIASATEFNISLGEPGLLHRPGTGLRLHPGTDETRFLKGVATKLARRKSDLILFATGRQALMGGDTLLQEGAGIVFDLRFTNYEWGASLVALRHDSLPLKDPDWEHAFRADDQKVLRGGIWGQCRLPFGILFGEAGWCPEKGTATIAGLRLFESHGFSSVVRVSSSSPGYPVAYTRFQTGTALNRSRTQVSLSYRYARSRHVTWYGALQAESDSWPDGTKFLQPTTRISQRLIWQFKNGWASTTTVSVGFGDGTSVLPDAASWKIQLDSDPGIKTAFRCRAGIQQTISGFGSTILTGTSGDFSLGFKLSNGRIRITSGCRVFSVAAGVPALYAYESDVLYGWSAPVLSGSGTRWYGMIRCKITEQVTLEAKISQSGYSDPGHLTDGNGGGLSGKVQVVWTGGGRI